MAEFSFVDLFAGIGGFHLALQQLGGRCVGAVENDARARAVYLRNFGDALEGPFLEDVVDATEDEECAKIPFHDVLTAGFPCQPFSKSGAQQGVNEARGTLFYNIARILESPRRPRVVILENVPNLIGPRHRATWDKMVGIIRSLGYWTPTEPIRFSPHLLHQGLGGTPQFRDRLFIVAVHLGGGVGVSDAQAREASQAVPYANVYGSEVAHWTPDDWDLTSSILQTDEEIQDLEYYRLTSEECEVVNAWGDFVERLGHPSSFLLPGFPIWLDAMTGDIKESASDPEWRQAFVRRNLGLLRGHGSKIRGWMNAHPEWRSWPASRRKLEWQAQGLERLRDGLLQFRPSGLRVKRPTYTPALVAMAQTSIFGPRLRRLTVREAARLQAFPDWFEFRAADGSAQSPSTSYRQLGNAVAVGAVVHVVSQVAEKWPFFPADIRDEILRARDILGRSTVAIGPVQGAML